MVKTEILHISTLKTGRTLQPKRLGESTLTRFGRDSVSPQNVQTRKKLFPTTKAEWEKMNPIKRELCGLAVLVFGMGGTLFMTLTMPKPNIGHALAFERCNSNHIKLQAERWERGEKQSKEQERKEAWEFEGLSLKSIFWSHFGSKALYTATVHLDPTYEPVNTPPEQTKLMSEKVKKAQINMGFFGGIANKLQILLFKFWDKYDVQNEGHYIPNPPPKLSVLDRLFLKHYFKTKPAWEYTEEERQKIAESYKK